MEIGNEVHKVKAKKDCSFKGLGQHLFLTEEETEKLVRSHHRTATRQPEACSIRHG